MFVALAIVSDEFFVSSLDFIIEKIGYSEDVADKNLFIKYRTRTVVTLLLFWFDFL